MLTDEARVRCIIIIISYEMYCVPYKGVSCQLYHIRWTLQLGHPLVSTGHWDSQRMGIGQTSGTRMGFGKRSNDLARRKATSGKSSPLHSSLSTGGFLTLLQYVSLV